MQIKNRLKALEDRRKARGADRTTSVVIYVKGLNGNISILSGDVRADTVLYIPDNGRQTDKKEEKHGHRNRK